MENDLIQIVIPIYNQDKYIEQCLNSVLQQTHQNWICTIVDDASTDRSGIISDNYSNKNSRINVIHHDTNKRLPQALNTGFKNTTAKYLTWISSDNWAEPNWLSTLYNNLKDTDDSIGLIYSNINLVDSDGKFKKIRNLNYRPKPNIPANMGSYLSQKNCIGASFLYKKLCMDIIGLYDTELEGCEDWDYWTRISEHFQFIFIENILYNYRDHKDSMSWRLFNQIRKMENVVREKTKIRRGCII